MPATHSKVVLPTTSDYWPEQVILDMIHAFEGMTFKKVFSSKYTYIAIAIAIAVRFGATYLMRKRRRNQPNSSNQRQVERKKSSNDGLSTIRKFWELVKIGLFNPNQAGEASALKYNTDPAYGREIWIMIALAGLVIFQTFIVNQNNSINGDLMASMVARDASSCIYKMFQITGILVLQSLINPSISSLIETLALRMRKNLTMDIHDRYYTDMVYYKILNLDKRVGAPDQRITQDVEVFCKQFSELFMDLLNPIVEVLLYTYELSRLIGSGGPISIISYVVIAFGVLGMVTPNFTKMSAEVQNKEGKFRSIHNRCKNNAELIAFYAGEETERLKVEKQFEELTSYSDYVINKNFLFGVVNDYFTKYSPHTVTSLIAGIPVFFGRLRPLPKDKLMGQLRYLIAVVAFEFFALGKIIELFRKLLKLSGMTQRVHLLYQVMDELKHGNSENINFKLRSAKQGGTGGEILESDEIKFDNVIIKTPDNITLARNLSFNVGKNQHIVITGPNGAGKSSLFRILGALWPLHSGTVCKPQAQGSNAQGLHKEIFYLPQKPYNVIGSLRSQIIYPDTQLKEGWSDERLKALLDDFGIGYLAGRHADGFDGKQDWDTLSRGEQQKLAMVRLFYHKPKYAILDECTSCISADNERELYGRCSKNGITCITISHRPALEKYHTQRLVFNGMGGWKWEAIKSWTEESSEYELKGQDNSIRDDKEEEEGEVEATNTETK
ncbi:hypothetical protein FDP41_001549 [Naegleria fowleri]|uniref:ABC transporter domain-containing protein n=1 Tax=Naegleria fowleri TaxID=5763 RepID=A0A6A5BVB5_NAEFO|nr:uncharacterized protein FDP41_001549 [Naegleria fowleri]KAF0979206.1 hypothetical protein FDP41_001549 [Naegleria fowleri]